MQGQQQATHGVQHGMQPPSLAFLPGAQQQPPQQQPQQPGIPAPAEPTITLGTINQILTAGKMPNGTELTPEMRTALEQRRDAMMQQPSAAAAMQAQRNAAAAAGQPQAAAAAMQAAMAAGARPPMPPAMARMGMPGMYSMAAAQGLPAGAQAMGVGIALPMGAPGGVLPQGMGGVQMGGGGMPPEWRRNSSR